MEEEEPGIIELDKSGFEYNSGGVKDHYCGHLLPEGTGTIFEHNGILYCIVGGSPNNGQKGYVVIPAEEYEGTPLTYGENNLLAGYAEEDKYAEKSWEPDDDLTEKLEACESAFGRFKRGYTGVGFTCKGKTYVFTNKIVHFHPKKHGNKIQDEFAWAKPEQEELKV